MFRFVWFCLLGSLALTSSAHSKPLRVATFNVSMEASNYATRESRELNADALIERLATGKEPQIRNIAEIIQRVRPDVLLLNEFDYIPVKSSGIDGFIKHYLNVSQQNQTPIHYPYTFIAPVNTGVDSGLDLDRDGVASGKGGDAYGYGNYPGQYGMAIVSRYPIKYDEIRTFQKLLWKDMPGNRLDQIALPDGTQWYTNEAKSRLRLSSKSHWDVPVDVDGCRIHMLASHPTPPAFDGPEKRNVHRNHDEIRFWVDYLDPNASDYIYDDSGKHGGASDAPFVILGDLNASVDEGRAAPQALSALLSHDKVVDGLLPTSAGGKGHTPDNPFGASHTAGWRMRADYAVPGGESVQLAGQGVFWPDKTSDLYRLVKDRKTSSDHRLVWVDIETCQK